MYPTTPTVQSWRATAARIARENGTEVPNWFDGSDAATGRLNTEFPDILSSVRWFMQDYVREHPADFPQNMQDAAAAFLTKNPRPGAYAGQFSLESYGIGSMAGDFAKAAADTAVAYTEDGILSAKGALGIKPDLATEKKAAGVSIAKAALAGLIVGVGVYFIQKEFA